MSHLDAQFISEMKERLLAQKAKLEEDLKGLAIHSEVGDDEDENATEVQMDDVNRDVTVNIQSDLEKIETALSKIEAGTYGVDSDGKEISKERLSVIPWADKAI